MKFREREGGTYWNGEEGEREKMVWIPFGLGWGEAEIVVVAGDSWTQ